MLFKGKAVRNLCGLVLVQVLTKVQPGVGRVGYSLSKDTDSVLMLSIFCEALAGIGQYWMADNVYATECC